MGDPVRRPSEDLESLLEPSQPLRDSRQDSLKDQLKDSRKDPAGEVTPGQQLPTQKDPDLFTAGSPVDPLGEIPRSEKPAQPQVKRKKRRSFILGLMLFLLVGVLAFASGAALAFYILNGDIDMDSQAVKETIGLVKGLFKSWRGSGP